MKKFFGIALLLTASSSAFAQEPTAPKAAPETVAVNRACTAAQRAACAKEDPGYPTGCIVVNNRVECILE